MGIGGPVLRESFNDEVTVSEKARFCVIMALEICFLLCFDCAAWHNLSFLTKIEPVHIAAEAWSLNHWTIREVLALEIIIDS